MTYTRTISKKKLVDEKELKRIDQLLASKDGHEGRILKLEHLVSEKKDLPKAYDLRIRLSLCIMYLDLRNLIKAESVLKEMHKRGYKGWSVDICDLRLKNKGGYLTAMQFKLLKEKYKDNPETLQKITEKENSLNALFDQAQGHIQDFRFEKAREIYETLTSMPLSDTQTSYVYNYLFTDHLLKKNLTKARQCLMKIKDQNYRTELSWIRLLREENKLEEAQKKTDELLKKYASEPEILSRINLKLKQNKFDNFLFNDIYSTNSLKINSTIEKICMMLDAAREKEKQGNIEEFKLAVQEIESELEKPSLKDILCKEVEDNLYSQIHYFAARLAEFKQNYELANELYGKIAEKAPSNFSNKICYASFLAKKYKDISASLKILQDLEQDSNVKLYPTRLAKVYKGLAVAYDIDGRVKECNHYRKLAFEKDPRLAASPYAKSFNYRHQNNKATGIYKKTRDLYEDKRKENPPDWLLTHPPKPEAASSIQFTSTNTPTQTPVLDHPAVSQTSKPAGWTVAPSPHAYSIREALKAADVESRSSKRSSQKWRRRPQSVQKAKQPEDNANVLSGTELSEPLDNQLVEQKQSVEIQMSLNKQSSDLQVNHDDDFPSLTNLFKDEDTKKSNSKNRKAIRQSSSEFKKQPVVNVVTKIKPSTPTFKPRSTVCSRFFGNNWLCNRLEASFKAKLIAFGFFKPEPIAFPQKLTKQEKNRIYKERVRKKARGA